MNILISDLQTMIKKYEKYQKLTKNFGKVIILKNKQPDSVLLSTAKYERLSKAFEKLDNLSKKNSVAFAKRLPSAGNREVYTLDQLKYDLYLSHDQEYMLLEK